MSYTKTVGFIQNNWGNLRGDGVNWKGKLGMKNGFSVFKDPKDGVRALFIDLTTKVSKGINTIEKIINMYAPPSENRTNEYINFVSKKTGIPKNKELGYFDLIEIAKSIILQEIGLNVDSTDYTKSIFKKGMIEAFGDKANEVRQQQSKGNIGLLIGLLIALLLLY